MNDRLVSAQTQIACLAGQNQPLSILLRFFFHFLQRHPPAAGRRSMSLIFELLLIIRKGWKGALLTNSTHNLCFSFKSCQISVLSVSFNHFWISTFYLIFNSCYTKQIFDMLIKCQTFLSMLDCQDIYIGTKAARWGGPRIRIKSRRSTIQNWRLKIEHVQRIKVDRDDSPILVESTLGQQLSHLSPNSAACS